MSAKMDYEYDKDFYAWAIHNAQLIREGKLAEIDIQNVAEELESMAKSTKRELVHRMAILISHLLRWYFQTAYRGKSWEYAIKGQRIQIRDILEESPSLNHEVEAKMSHAYEQAVIIAVKQTGLDESSFPKKCPYTFEQCLNNDFLPE